MPTLLKDALEEQIQWWDSCDVKETKLQGEQNVPEKYYLSKNACQGILRRAESNGKALPTALKDALKEQIEWWENRDVKESGSQE